MLEKDLGDAREHLTSCQSILKIIRIYFKKTKNFFFHFLSSFNRIKHFFNNSCENQKFQLFELKIYFTA